MSSAVLPAGDTGHAGNPASKPPTAIEESGSPDHTVLEAGIGSVILFCEDPPPNEDNWTVEEVKHILTLPPFVKAGRALTKINRLSRRLIRFRSGTSGTVMAEVYVFARVEIGM